LASSPPSLLPFGKRGWSVRGPAFFLLLKSEEFGCPRSLTHSPPNRERVSAMWSLGEKYFLLLVSLGLFPWKTLRCAVAPFLDPQGRSLSRATLSLPTLSSPRLRPDNFRVPLDQYLSYSFFRFFMPPSHVAKERKRPFSARGIIPGWFPFLCPPTVFQAHKRENLRPVLRSIWASDRWDRSKALRFPLKFLALSCESLIHRFLFLSPLKEIAALFPTEGGLLSLLL